jgi:hypothetical protein
MIGFNYKANAPAPSLLTRVNRFLGTDGLITIQFGKSTQTILDELNFDQRRASGKD